jgi:creatinine amidohydrolase
VLFVNGHGGNTPTLADAVRLLRYEGRDAAWFACAPVIDPAPTRPPRAPREAAAPGRITGGDAHAGRTETSLVLALDPTLVGTERPAGNPAPLGDLLPTMRTGGVVAVSPNGVLGDPAGASAEEGERLLAAMTADLVAALERWTPDAAGRLR